MKYPTTKQANLMFLLISAAILLGSTLLAPRLGLGTNLWINEYLWILTPSVLLVRLGRMPVKEVFRLRKTSGRNILIGGIAAVCIWFFAFYLSKITGLFLNSRLGALDTGSAGNAVSVNQSILMLIGMIILAPICEELLFRGVIQSAYETHNRKYGFVASAIFFGMFHVLNGITDVIPTFFTGLLLGYIVYRTGSIAASMFAHMLFNFCALFINGGLGLSLLNTIPLWLHCISIAGAITAVLLLCRLVPTDLSADSQVTAERKKYSVGSIVTFALSGLYVILVGAAEIYVRQML